MSKKTSKRETEWMAEVAKLLEHAETMPCLFFAAPVSFCGLSRLLFRWHSCYFADMRAILCVSLPSCDNRIGRSGGSSRYVPR